MHFRYYLTFSLIIGIATISCATAPAKSTPPAANPQPAAASPAVKTASGPEMEKREAQTRKLIAELTQVRGLAETRPLDVSYEDAAQFKASLEHAASADDSDVKAEQAKWIAFGFAPASANPREIAMKVLGEQVAAFYDPKTKRLHVPIDAPAGAGDKAALEQETVLVHEAEHGLQDQHFPFPDLEKMEDNDLALAYKALYEGDATLAMIAVPAARAHALDGKQLLGEAQALRQLPIESLEAMSGRQSPELRDAPKIVREELIFPYFGGLLLAAERYALGGNAALDELFRHPPESTEQVLHTGKYAAGERPIQMTPPSLPAGAKELSRGKLGELLIRTLLSDCLPALEAARGAEGWGGDAYLIAQRADGSMLVEWSFAADDASATPPLAKMLRRASEAGCFPEVKASAPGGFSLPAGAVIAEAPGRVVLLRGVPANETEALEHALLAAPITRLPDQPPPAFGDRAALVKAEKAASAPAALDADRHWSDPELGLQLTIPAGLTASTDGRALLKVTSPHKDVGALVLIPAADSPETRKMIFAPLIGQFAQANIEVTASPSVSRKLGGREASEQILSAPNTPVEMHMVFLPLCGGSKTLLFTTNGLKPEGKAKLAAWVESAQLSDGAPACK